jgi:hypothetical protein
MGRILPRLSPVAKFSTGGLTSVIGCGHEKRILRTRLLPYRAFIA